MLKLKVKFNFRICKIIPEDQLWSFFCTLTALNEELNFICSYLLIQSIRFHTYSRFHVQIAHVCVFIITRMSIKFVYYNISQNNSNISKYNPADKVIKRYREGKGENIRKPRLIHRKKYQKIISLMNIFFSPKSLRTKFVIPNAISCKNCGGLIVANTA